jgi:septal ring-binding cell division protein DamX
MPTRHPPTVIRPVPPGARRLGLPVAVSLVLGLVGVVGGCAGGASRAPSDSASYVAQFARGDYADAKTTALAQAGSTSGVERDRANLIAGLSAAQLGENAEATRLLSGLTTHADREIAGRAIAGTGLVARNQGDKARGASLMAEGAKKLTGDIAAKAHMAAGDTYAEIGARDQAIAEYTAGAAVAQRADIKASLVERQEGKRYTVQLGAFANKANADKRAGEVQSKAVSLGLGTPRIQSSLRGGKTSFLVQVGNFATRQEAKTASLKMGGSAIVSQIEMN